MIQLEDLNVVEKIGFGSYSTVYKAYRKNTNKCVAVKVVETAKLSSRGKKDIVTEIQVMKMLNHKHIVQMKDFKWDNKNIFIIMEYCDGGDLSSFIKRRCKLPEKTCQKFLQQLAVGLQFLRSYNLSHLDLKPQNLLLVTKPKVILKIGDFGFAQFLSETTQKCSIRGSPLYMAPEMLLGGKYDARADLWSVGVITYECLFGRAPYSSGSYSELFSRIKNKAPVVIPNDTNLSNHCLDFLRNLLVHDPDIRMSYDSFFNHSFLDLEHMPTEANHKKALAIFCEAEKLDNAKAFIEAFNKYCEGLHYLLPIYQEESVGEIKATLKAQLTTYTKRAEDLKKTLTVETDTRSQCSSSSSSTQLKPNSVTTSQSQTVCNPKYQSVTDCSEKLIPRDVSLKQLLSLCSNTPHILTAIEIGVNAQMYLAEGKYELALEKYQSSLGILIPALVSEPFGPRKNMLYLQVQKWMKQAESTKSLLLISQDNDQQSLPIQSKETCTVQ